jgi:hypothetical protein
MLIVDRSSTRQQSWLPSRADWNLREGAAGGGPAALLGAPLGNLWTAEDRGSTPSPWVRGVCVFSAHAVMAEKSSIVRVVCIPSGGEISHANSGFSRNGKKTKACPGRGGALGHRDARKLRPRPWWPKGVDCAHRGLVVSPLRAAQLNNSQPSTNGLPVWGEICPRPRR